MSIVLVAIIFLSMTGLLANHINNESQLSRRLIKSSLQIQQKLDARNLDHIDFSEKFQDLSIFKQIRILEYYMHVLDDNYKQYMHKKSIFERVEMIEQSLMPQQPLQFI